MGEKVDFSGEWTFNESKSEMGEGRFRRSSELAVKQQGDELTIERTRTGRDGEERTTSENLTLNGKETLTERENRTTKTTAKWTDGGQVISITSVTTMERDGESFEFSRSETWTLSEIGKTLTIQSSFSSSRGEGTATLVYDKE